MGKMGKMGKVGKVGKVGKMGVRYRYRAGTVRSMSLSLRVEIQWIVENG